MTKTFSERFDELSTAEVGLLIRPANGVKGIPLSPDQAHEVGEIVRNHLEEQELAKILRIERVDLEKAGAGQTELDEVDGAIAAFEAGHMRDAETLKTIVREAAMSSHHSDPVGTELFIAEWAPIFTTEFTATQRGLQLAIHD